MGAVVAVADRDSREEILIGLVGQEVAVSQSLFPEIRQQIVAGRIGLQTRAVLYLNQIEHRRASVLVHRCGKSALWITWRHHNDPQQLVILDMNGTISGGAFKYTFRDFNP